MISDLLQAINLKMYQMKIVVTMSINDIFLLFTYSYSIVTSNAYCINYYKSVFLSYFLLYFKVYKFFFISEKALNLKFLSCLRKFNSIKCIS